MNSSLSNITWSPGGTTQVGVTSASLTVTMTGTYTCTAANDCGSTTASTAVRSELHYSTAGLYSLKLLLLCKMRMISMQDFKCNFS